MFKIDFFELLKLAKYNMPTNAAQSTDFFEKLINTYYKQMHVEQRLQMFESITNDKFFNKEIDICLFFYNRFDPENQYIVTSDYGNEITKYECFKHKDKFFVSTRWFVSEEFIIEYESIKTEKKQ